VAKAGAKSTSPIVWLSLAQALALVTEIYLSPSYAKRLLTKWLQAGRIRWQSRAFDGFIPKGLAWQAELPSLWSDPDCLWIYWDEGRVRKVVRQREGPPYRFDVIGIRLARDDILRCLPLREGALAQTLDVATVSATGTVSGPGRAPKPVRPKSPQRQVFDSLLRRKYPPDGHVPDEDTTTAVWDWVRQKEQWPAECQARGIPPKHPLPPHWSTVHRWLSREGAAKNHPRPNQPPADIC
jgi:hypothetical protein